MTYAVIGTGGKQYRVSEGETVEVERLEGEPGDAVVFDRVLLVGGDGGVAVGTPHLEGASVEGKIVEQGRGPKLVVFKKKRRKQYKRTQGHRQELTSVRIEAIRAGA